MFGLGLPSTVIKFSKRNAFVVERLLLACLAVHVMHANNFF